MATGTLAISGATTISAPITLNGFAAAAQGIKLIPVDTDNNMFALSLGDFANGGDAARPNAAMSLGYNLASSGRINASDHAFGSVIESWYKPSSTAQLEFYYQFYTTAGTSYRPLGITIPLEGASANTVRLDAYFDDFYFSKRLDNSTLGIWNNNGITSYRSVKVLADDGSKFKILLSNQSLGVALTSDSPVWWVSTDDINTGSQDVALRRNAAGVLEIDNGTAGQYRDLQLRAINPTAGNIGIGTTSPWRTLAVTGTVGFDGLTGATGAGSLCLDSNKQLVYNSGTDACLSSLRATKHDINILSLSGTEMIAALSPVSFIYNNDASSTLRYGFIAEDAAAVDPHFATRDATGKLSGIDDRGVIAVVVKALQELIADLKSLGATVASFADS